jgi:hypothetical protein
MLNIRRMILLGSILACSPLILIQGCSKGTSQSKTRTYTYTLYTPIYQLKQSVLAAINGDPLQPIDSLGKIYIKDNLIFLNDVDKGIHVIDNSDPTHPTQIAFLNIPGTQDIAIKGNTLFADMYSDLLSIDITDLHHVQINTMLPALFTDRQYVNGYSMDSNQVIVNWIKKDTTVTVPANYYYPPNGIYWGYSNNSFAPAASSAANQVGVAGSTAKMVLINNYLYAITEMHMLGSIDITNPKAPVLASNFDAGFDLETIYPFKDKLFLGSDIGTFIYDISNPANPTQTGQFTHGQACDPVITDGTYAYITLHAGTSCGGASNELDVVNVQNLSEPSLVRTYPMTSPEGLSKDGNLLFVCDGPNSVRVFDATAPDNLKLLSLVNAQGPYDVIAANHDLLVVGSQGLNQYYYGDAGDIRQLSFYAIK